MLPVQRVQVWSLVRELRSHMPLSQNSNNKKSPEHEQQKQRCNKFNRGLKNSSHQKKSKAERQTQNPPALVRLLWSEAVQRTQRQTDNRNLWMRQKDAWRIAAKIIWATQTSESHSEEKNKKRLGQNWRTREKQAFVHLLSDVSEEMPVVRGLGPEWVFYFPWASVSLSRGQMSSGGSWAMVQRWGVSASGHNLGRLGGLTPERYRWTTGSHPQ